MRIKILMFLSILIFISITIFFSYCALINEHFDTPILISVNIFWGYTGAGLIVSILLTSLIFLPKDSEWMLLEIKQAELIAEIGRKRANVAYTSLTILFIVFPAAIIYSSDKVIDNYKTEQLKKYGITCLSEIANTTTGDKGVRLAIVFYQYKNITYWKELPLEKHKVHDSLRIMFSAKNPKIAIATN